MSELLQHLLDGSGDLDVVFRDLMRHLCMEIDAGRCCLYLRHPDSLLSRRTHTWARKPEFDLPAAPPDWKPQSPTLVDDDPMFAEALVNPEALYIEDIEAEGPEVLNAEFERNNYGHRALVHAPIYNDGKMYGILEPSVFGAARVWTRADRETVRMVQGRLGVLVPRYVAKHCR